MVVVQVGSGNVDGIRGGCRWDMPARWAVWAGREGSEWLSRKIKDVL
jgi:hypothetical protein